ncbi:methyl-accepting chemotaxis protein [Cytobacillus suaedae]|nr:methyl-accepting chemotaxis protein [Cytobacillus suaedae]
MKFIQSLKFKLPFIMIILLVLPLTIVGFMSYQKTEILEHAVIQKTDMEAISGKFEKIFNDYEKLIQDLGNADETQFETFSFPNTAKNSITNMPSANDPVKEEYYQEHLRAFESQHEYLLNTYIASENGEFYLSNIPPAEVDLTKFDPRQRDWYTQAIEANGEVIWTTPYIDTGTGKSTITLAKTVTDANGAVIGVIGFDFDMHKLSVLIREGLRNTTMLVAAIFIVVGVAIVSLFILSFNKTLTTLQDSMSKVADGDLSVEPLEVKRKDELGFLMISFNDMVKSLKDLISKVIETSQHVAASAQQLSANADETSRATEQIASSIQEVSSGAELQQDRVSDSTKIVGQISEDISDISNRADSVATSSQEMSDKAKAGSQIVGSAIEQMEIITHNTEQTAEVIEMLNKKSSEIEEIITLIKGIADQTNLLALNAAIEAARAGEHGKGFAVVADEVRKLAEQSSKSTKQIGDIIAEIQHNTVSAVESMKNGEHAVKKGTDLVGRAGMSFEEISVAVTDVSERMNTVSASISQIYDHTNSLVESIQSVSSITEQTSAFTQEVASATEEQTASMEEVSAATRVLADSALELQDIAKRFKI